MVCNARWSSNLTPIWEIVGSNPIRVCACRILPTLQNWCFVNLLDKIKWFIEILLNSFFQKDCNLTPLTDSISRPVCLQVKTKPLDGAVRAGLSIYSNVNRHQNVSETDFFLVLKCEKKKKRFTSKVQSWKGKRLTLNCERCWHYD
jgi:hypothetical protein